MFAGLFVLWFIDVKMSKARGAGLVNKERVVHALFASFIAWTLAEILKRVFMTPRPFDLNDSQTYTLLLPIDPGFPSAHTAVVFALSITIFLHDRKYGGLFLILAMLVGWARILANVHFPVDIFGGAILGTAIALINERKHLKY